MQDIGVQKQLAASWEDQRKTAKKLFPSLGSSVDVKQEPSSSGTLMEHLEGSKGSPTKSKWDEAFVYTLYSHSYVDGCRSSVALRCWPCRQYVAYALCNSFYERVVPWLNPLALGASTFHYGFVILASLTQIGVNLWDLPDLTCLAHSLNSWGGKDFFSY